MLKTPKDNTAIKKVFLNLSKDEEMHVDESLGRYLKLVKRIYEHVRVNDPIILTELQRRARLRKRLKKAHK